MSANPPTPKGSLKAPLKDRRAAPDAAGARGSLRRMKGALGRPIGLETRDGQLHVVLVERRSAPRPDAPPALPQLCAELRALLLARAPDEAALMMRHLVRVHDALAGKGWAAVAALPAWVIGSALVQAEMLSREEPSPALQTIMEQLRPLHDEAAQRNESEARMQHFKVGEHLEVTESTYAEFQEMERSWVGTVPSALAPRNRDS